MPTYQVFFDKLVADSVFIEAPENATDEELFKLAWDELTLHGYEREEILEGSFDFQKEE